MMPVINKHATTFAGALAIMVILGILAYTQLEIYEDTQYTRPSEEARRNSYLALERWLAGAGQQTRTSGFENAPALISVPEKTVYIEASRSFDWDEDTWNTLEPWLSEGAHLVLALDRSRYDENLSAFLTHLGIRPRRINSYSSSTDEEARYREVDIDPPVPPVSDTFPPVSDTPPADFDKSVGFTAFFDEAEPDKEPRFPDTARTLRDTEGVIRLVTVPVGAGLVTVTGRPWFMYNHNLEEEQNARLSWELMGAAGSDVLFIRELAEVAPSFWGRIVERGSLLPLIVSLLLLLAVVFWMLIPVFGVLREDAPKPGKLIRERFLAEGRFLRKYGALDTYYEAYLREVRREARRVSRDEQSDAAIPPVATSLAPFPKDKDFMKYLITLQKLMKTYGEE